MDSRKRVLTLEPLQNVLSRHRSSGDRIVFTNGCFDLMHLGHVRYLTAAAELGDVLVVGLNSDDSVKLLKGEGRPILPEEERAELLAALRPVDYVVVFGGETPEALIRVLEPEVLVKGGDYDPDATSGPRMIVGADLVRSRGGEVRVIDFVEGRSTSSILEKIRGDLG